jgi:hypothetical protein
MRKFWMAWILASALFFSVEQISVAGDHSIGVGARYWTALGDIDVDDVDESGLAYLVSYQYRPAMLLKFGVDVEMLPEQFAGAVEDVYAPQVYVIIGSVIYAGVGIGGYFTDGEFAEDSFYNVRAGVDLSLFPFIHLDINANYRFEEWADINDIDEDISEDTITIGATVRLSL